MPCMGDPELTLDGSWAPGASTHNVVHGPTASVSPRNSLDKHNCRTPHLWDQNLLFRLHFHVILTYLKVGEVLSWMTLNKPNQQITHPNIPLTSLRPTQNISVKEDLFVSVYRVLCSFACTLLGCICLIKLISRKSARKEPYFSLYFHYTGFVSICWFLIIVLHRRRLLFIWRQAIKLRKKYLLVCSIKMRRRVMHASTKARWLDDHVLKDKGAVQQAMTVLATTKTSVSWVMCCSWPFK